MNIIGLVGSIASGKGVVADYLINTYGYTSFSLSTIIHEEIKKKGITQFTRTTLQDIGDTLRKKEGDAVLAKQAIESLKVFRSESPKSTVPRSSFQVQKIIIEGIRNPGEVVYLRTIPGFILIAVDAAAKVRFKRILERGKPWDPKDWNSFLMVDGRDSEDPDNKNGQHVQACIKMADVTIENNGSREQMQVNCKKIVERLGFRAKMMPAL